ncbi:MAG: tryptophan--tRNA ligase [Patescibacteria group bacterium]
MKIKKPTLISGIRPTGRLHLGNYLGALKHFVELQNSGKYQYYFFIADLHSLNADFNPKQKKKEILNLLADFLATGLSPTKSTIFIQSQIPAHTELANILTNIAYVGELKRMTQFKELSKNQPKNINAGLFVYPTLMAADIILYDAKFVPVGEDQVQHLEIARELARRFNNRFGKTFTEPQPLLTKTPRIMSLDNPKKKMSKSQPHGCIFIDDLPEDIEAKVMVAVTDSGREVKYNPKKKPGISNLLEIYSALSDKSIKQLEKQFANKGYGDFKKATAKLIASHFASYRNKKTVLLKNSSKLTIIARKGSKRASKVAKEKMKVVRKKLGLI